MDDIEKARELRNRHSDLWPRYTAAAEGLRNYWYPVMWSRDLKSRTVAIKLCGEPIMLRREKGKVHGFYDQCPHRGIPLSVGRQEFPGTWSCRYHGWTFDLESGVLVAALTDGADSGICGKVRVKKYPVEERAGLIWVYVGDQAPPPVEEDIPPEFLDPRVVVCGRISVQKGNWRFACENGFDEGHANFLHRYGAVYSMFRALPAWRRAKVVPDEGGYISRATIESGSQGDYPGLGTWPKKQFWKRSGKGHRVGIRLPCIMRVKAAHEQHAYWAWWTPVDANSYRMLQFYTKPTSGIDALKFRLAYALYRKPVHHVQFNGQDAWMVRLMPETGPERLYRPDSSITAWRKLCEHARGEAPAQESLPEALDRIDREHAEVSP
jgi:phenylpropionate dioxygenase-like ring-hydroxylating dioxygenase large terminal subunit